MPKSEKAERFINWRNVWYQFDKWTSKLRREYNNYDPSTTQCRDRVEKIIEKELEKHVSAWK